ncbi:monovalent cation/H+ antiporter subunit A [Hydrogenophaga laconesensis]|uniref:Multicomponent K+:H+ antiporter subunit A n=1 Tax=Hydrogenophaga laconesensis TaxID=1805971 RepID=A0ABU1V7R9_9BURK|nr:monovalent cation/H+ antiporter subunit A [Hydrogenophaga laconesensis]MDR7093496.1 multicomponent K+:H+ antiporter subunit A [Hydrogenophaga laconesensis]
MHFSLIFLVALPFLGSLLAALLPANARNTESTLAGAIALFCAVQTAMYFPEVAAGGVIRQEFVWLPSLGLNFVLRMDGFAWMFSMLVLGIGSLVVLYARYYMSPDDPVPRFFSFLLAFMGAMSGVVLSGNLVQLVLFWELTSLFSFLLIGYWHHRRDARRGARMALTVTGAGGLCLLAGVLVLGHIVGSYDLDVVLLAGDVVRQHPLYSTALILILLGALTKSAQFPFQFWLPHAMAAPTPVSAYLHSATMVKAGVFLLARLWPVLAGTDEWFWIVTCSGLITLLIGGFAAIFQNDLKGLLAYSTISHLGLITTLLGMNSPLAAVAAVFHIINHATFKASLFMAVGIIDHEAGTRDIRRLSGLARYMPVTATLTMVAGAAMAGVPLLNGFISKEMFFTEAVFVSAAPWFQKLLPTAAVVAGMFSVAYSLRFTARVFFGPDTCAGLPRVPHEPPHWMRVPIEILVLACLVVGILPQWSIQHILGTAALPVVGGDLPEFDLAVWHGFNLPLWMSFLALAGGIVLYLLLRKPLYGGHIERAPVVGRYSGKRAFHHVMARLTAGSRSLLRLLGTRRLQPQLFLLVLVTVVGSVAAFRLATPGAALTPGDRELLPFSPMFALLWVVGVGAAVGAVWQAKYHRLTALALMSVSGLTTVITFAWFSAPDLALTQLSVEAVTTVLILLGLRWLPKRLEVQDQAEPLWQRVKAKGRRSRDLVLALAAGAGMTGLSYAVMTREFPQSISPFFLERSLPEGGGTNVVNVMLVDFRGFDTLGEITVLGIVALTVYALLRRFRPAPESAELTAQQRALPADLDTDLINPQLADDTAQGYLMVPAVLVRLLLPIAAVIAVYLFMRGHNEPGGGFVAGLVLSTAFILQYIVSGTQWVEANMQLMPQRWIAAGLLTATATGLGAFWFGYPFLTTHTAHLHLPLLGDIHVASALFYDIGVFTLVVGATLLILTALGHQSVRGHRQAKVAEQENPAQQEGAA